MVCRSGSNTVTEVSGVGLPAVFVPLPIGNGEQALNTKDQVDAGGAILVDNAAFTPAWVGTTLVPLLEDRALVAEMAARSKSIGVLDGSDRMVALVEAALVGKAVGAP